MSKYKEYGYLYLKGIAMGAADVIPGVSGGTIAFITGIYEELIRSIQKISIGSLATLKNNGLKAFWQEINATFLLVLFLGIGTSILSFSHGITFLLHTYPEMLWAFFFGLILASSFLVSKHIKGWTVFSVILFIVGALIAYLISVASPAAGNEQLYFVFFSGMLSICAMILPGISGAFILLLLGMYGPIIEALKTFQLDKILVFMSGCLIGLLAFSRALNWMFKHYHNQTIALLTGFMLGSLNKVWPWKITLETWIDRHGELKPLVQENVSPFSYENLSGQSPEFVASLCLAIGALIIVVALDKFGKLRHDS